MSQEENNNLGIRKLFKLDETITNALSYMISASEDQSFRDLFSYEDRNEEEQYDFWKSVIDSATHDYHLIDKALSEDTLHIEHSIVEGFLSQDESQSFNTFLNSVKGKLLLLGKQLNEYNKIPCEVIQRLGLEEDYKDFQNGVTYEENGLEPAYGVFFKLFVLNKRKSELDSEISFLIETLDKYLLKLDIVNTNSVEQGKEPHATDFEKSEDTQTSTSSESKIRKPGLTLNTLKDLFTDENIFNKSIKALRELEIISSDNRYLLSEKKKGVFAVWLDVVSTHTKGVNRQEKARLLNEFFIDLNIGKDGGIFKNIPTRVTEEYKLLLKTKIFS